MNLLPVPVAPERRYVPMANLAVCANGHVVAVEPAGWGWERRCPYGHWAPDDANYCGRCGTTMRPLP